MFKFLLIACIVGYCSPSKVFQTKAECVKNIEAVEAFRDGCQVRAVGA